MIFENLKLMNLTVEKSQIHEFHCQKNPKSMNFTADQKSQNEFDWEKSLK